MSRTRTAVLSLLGASILAMGMAAGAGAQVAAGPTPPPPAGHEWAGHEGDPHHAPWEHVDGRIAYLRAELKITPQQEAAFKGLETVIRQQAETMKQQMEKHHAEMEKRHAEAKAAMAGGHGFPHPSLTEALDREQEMLTQHTKFLADYRAAAEPLYAALSPEQKAKADLLLLPHPHGGFGHGGWGHGGPEGHPHP